MPRPGLAPLLAPLFVFGGVLPAGCGVSPPTPEAWLDVGFRTPEQTFRSFQTALRSDQADLEYRCLSSDMRRRVTSQLGYRVFREELEKEQPWFRHFARAKVVASHPHGEGRHRIVAEVSFLWSSWRFAIDLVREDYWELWEGDERAADDAAEYDRLVRLVGPPRALQVRIPLEDWVEPATVSEVRVGREWKIDGFLQLEEDEEEHEHEPQP